MKTKLLIVSMFLALLWASTALGQLLDFALNRHIQEVMPGGRVTFDATLTNRGNNTLFLNGTGFNLGGQTLSLDDTDFFPNFPRSLEPGQSVTASIFDVTVDSSSVPDSYSGSFTIFGGSAPSDLVELATQIYAVTVIPESNGR
jgi:hypothetical protein